MSTLACALRDLSLASIPAVFFRSKKKVPTRLLPLGSSSQLEERDGCPLASCPERNLHSEDSVRV